MLNKGERVMKHNNVKYMSISADADVQQIFEKFLTEKKIKKSVALTGFLEIFMIATDEELYLKLKKESLNVEKVKDRIEQEISQNSEGEMTEISNEDWKDGIILRMTPQVVASGDELNEEEILKKYRQVEEEKGFSWISMNGPSRGSGINPKLLDDFCQRLELGEHIPIYFLWNSEVQWSADIIEMVSGAVKIECPEDTSAVPVEFRDEENRTWLKIINLKREEEYGIDDLIIAGNGHSVRSVLLNSQLVFGYVHPANTRIK